MICDVLSSETPCCPGAASEVEPVEAVDSVVVVAVSVAVNAGSPGPLVADEVL